MAGIQRVGTGADVEAGRGDCAGAGAGAGTGTGAAVLEDALRGEARGDDVEASSVDGEGSFVSEETVGSSACFLAAAAAAAAAFRCLFSFCFLFLRLIIFAGFSSSILIESRPSILRRTLHLET